MGSALLPTLGLCLRKGQYMSNIKNLLISLMEQDSDWAAHRSVHSLHPNPSCGYCCQDADVPVEVLESEVEE